MVYKLTFALLYSLVIIFMLTAIVFNTFESIDDNFFDNIEFGLLKKFDKKA